jgi:hypothetical protein
MTDQELVAKHFKRACDLAMGDNAQGSIVLEKLPSRDGYVRCRVHSKGAEWVACWAPVEWIPLGDELPPKEATEALLRIE